MKKWLAIVAITALGAAAARADWRNLGEVAAGSKSQASDVAVAGTVRVVQVECTDGTVLVNVVSVREGAAKTDIRVMRRFNKGDTQDIDLGYDRNVTGLRISLQGPGRLRVNAK